MYQSPLFSVIIPTRNRSHLIERALSGVEIQTCKNLEVILVDDSSEKNESLKIDTVIKKFNIPIQIVYLKSSNPLGNGPCVARNFGAAAAQGKYLAFCDDDDQWIDDRHLEIAKKTFNITDNTDYYFADQQAVINGKIKTKSWLPYLKNVVEKRKSIFHDVYMVYPKEIIMTNRFPHLNTTIVKKSFFEKIGGFHEAFRYSQDLHFSLKAMDAASEILFRNFVVSRHYIPDRSASINSSTRISIIEKQLYYLSISNHIRYIAKNPAVLYAADRDAGYAMKRLSEYLAKQKLFKSALSFAKQANAVAPTFQWRLYTLYLKLCTFFR